MSIRRAHKLIRAHLQDQAPWAVISNPPQLLGRLALRKNELRLLRIGDFDLARGEVRVHGKGGKVVVLPLGFADLIGDLELHLVGESRQPDEYLLYPKRDRLRPLDPASVHRWFKRRLEVAGLPATIEMHELRHSAAPRG